MTCRHTIKNRYSGSKHSTNIGPSKIIVIFVVANETGSRVSSIQFFIYTNSNSYTHTYIYYIHTDI